MFNGLGFKSRNREAKAGRIGSSFRNLYQRIRCAVNDWIGIEPEG